jgi:DNA-binding LacI/PurR family transcriptional regulator
VDLKAERQSRQPIPKLDFGDRRTPICDQLRESIRRQILEGRLKSGDALMPVRKLCKELGVNRVTADQAIRDLVMEGLLRSQHGRGVFVNDVSPFRVVVAARIPHEKLSGPGFYRNVLADVQDALARANARAVVLGRAAHEKFGPDLEKVMAEEAHGYLCIGIQSEEYLAALVSSGRPVVALDAAPLKSSFDGVVFDSFRSGYLAARHLLELGHTRILSVGHDRGINPNDPAGKARIPEPDSERIAAGISYALKEAAVNREETKRYEYYDRKSEMRTELTSDLKSGKYTAAIFNQSLAETLKQGGELPPALSVVLVEADPTSPNLKEWTHIDLDHSQVGQVGVMRMLQRLNEARRGEKTPLSGSLWTIEPRLVEGTTTHRVGPPPAIYEQPAPRPH